MSMHGIGASKFGWGFLGAALALGLAGLGGGGGEGEAAEHVVLRAPTDSDPKPLVITVQSPGRALDVSLRRAGVFPAALAAVGVGTSGLASVLGGADEWLVEQQEALATLDAGCNAARKERDALQRRVRSGLASPEEIADLQQAKATLATREAARDELLSGLFAAASANLSGPQTAALAAIRANEGKSAPIHFLVEAREPAIWLRLRDALANERIAPLFEEEPNSEAQSFLAALRARQAVAQAKSQHDALIAVVEASWSASLLGPQ